MPSYTNAGSEQCQVDGSSSSGRRRHRVTITPYLCYQDVTAAMKWLAKAFGFKRYGVQMKSPDGTVIHAAMQVRDGIFMMGAPGGK